MDITKLSREELGKRLSELKRNMSSSGQKA